MKIFGTCCSQEDSEFSHAGNSQMREKPLLSPQKWFIVVAGRQDGRVIAIREDAAGGIKVSGIHAETCGTEEEMFRCLSDGSVQRTTGATLMNEQSSRWGGWLEGGVCGKGGMDRYNKDMVIRYGLRKIYTSIHTSFSFKSNMT